MFRRLAAPLAAAALMLGTHAHAQQIDKKEFNVVGTWNFLTNFQLLEKPFWTEELPKATNGNLKGNVKALNELNLKGTELLRLLKQGVFDFAYALPIYVEDGGAVMEALDIAGVARNYDMARDIVNTWMPEMRKVMLEKHNAIILSTHTWPEQNFYCRGDVKSVEDIKGKKVRVQGTSQADLVAALGGTGVTITFAEVVPALEKGVVDCAITGTMPAYKAKWPEVTNSLFRLPVGFTAGILVVNATMFNKLSPDTQNLLKKLALEQEEKAWKLAISETEDGVYCTTGTGNCPAGPPGKLKLNKPADADAAARDKALNDLVLKNWAKRCGAECAAKWTEMIGKKYGLVAKAD
ncbi:MAG TPA: TRAP transporter substrate-binding protein [Hyphomicrobiaceae bacterium]|nr:TRAP transporter substrate-binding protein [Hyphomicrobiaceae bacterium]